MDIIMSQVNSLSTASKSQPPDRLTPIWRGAVRDALDAPPSLFACKDTTLFLSPQGGVMVLFLLPSSVLIVGAIRRPHVDVFHGFGGWEIDPFGKISDSMSHVFQFVPTKVITL